VTEVMGGAENARASHVTEVMDGAENAMVRHVTEVMFGVENAMVSHVTEVMDGAENATGHSEIATGRSEIVMVRDTAAGVEMCATEALQMAVRLAMFVGKCFAAAAGSGMEEALSERCRWRKTA